jgi:hypothetical protein
MYRLFVAVITALAIAGAMLAGAALLSSLDGSPGLHHTRIVLRAATSSSVPVVTPKRAARFVLKCLTTPFTVGCATSKWDNDVKIVLAATRHAGSVIKWCPPRTHYGAWRIGFCLGREDDGSPAHIVWSDEGIYSRASLVH